MSQITTEQLIKIILGVFVVAAVGVGLYIFFKDQIIDFFKNLSIGTKVPGIFFTLLK
ncbi:MAG: hypothetical protein NTU63_02805 [Candidatus Pacearchaeota archaeon]|nr:hypothetical protein [Candidatus Pacearchaeota archaeon]